jgi:enoyl-CoA hydratase
MSYRNILYVCEGPVGVLTINRPDKLNALNEETLSEIDDVVSKVRKADEVQVLILTGAGPKSFIAGADIGELSKLDVVGGVAKSRKGQELLNRIQFMGKPTIAAVNGYALGGGTEMALSCSLRLASENAKFGLPEVKLAVIPGYGGTQRLARLVGRGRALELILTGKQIDAQEAYRIGLVNGVFPLDGLLDAAKRWAQEVCANGPVAVRLALEAVERGLECPFQEGLVLEANLFGVSAATEDMREGLNAFLEKRRPSFKGV